MKENQVNKQVSDAGVILITACDAHGIYQPLPQDTLKTKFAGVENLAAKGMIHTVVLAENQTGWDENTLLSPVYPQYSFNIIKTKNPKTLKTRLDALGGALGESLRKRILDNSQILKLIGNREVQWDKLYQELSLQKLTRPEPKLDREDQKTPHSHVMASQHEAGQDDSLIAEPPRPFSEMLHLKGSRFKAILLGLPGAGKTMFMRWAARQLIQKDDLDKVALPVVLNLASWEKSDQKHIDLIEQIAFQTGHKSDNSKKWLTLWHKQSRLFLLFDGLDEVHPDFITQVLEPELKKLECPWIITCRKAATHHYEILLPNNYQNPEDGTLGAALIELGTLDEAAQKVYLSAYPWQRPERQQALADHIETTLQIKDMAANPQLLSLLCFAADKIEDLPLPLHRAGLYQLAIGQLLAAPSHHRNLPQTGWQPADRQRLLGELCLQLAVLQNRPTQFDQDMLFDMYDAAESSLPPQVWRRLPELKNLDDMTLFLDDLVARGLLLSTNIAGNTLYSFNHLTLQEFLAAEALARHIDRIVKDEEAEAGKVLLETKDITFDQTTKPVGEWLRNWVLEEVWEETMLMSAGCLKNPAPLLELIFDEDKDTLIRHYLVVAARMTGEILPRKYYDDTDSVTETIQKIRDTTQIIIFDMTKDERSVRILKHFRHATQMIWSHTSPKKYLLSINDICQAEKNGFFKIFGAKAACPSLVEKLKQMKCQHKQLAVKILTVIGIETKNEEPENGNIMSSNKKIKSSELISLLMQLRDNKKSQNIDQSSEISPLSWEHDTINKIAKRVRDISSTRTKSVTVLMNLLQVTHFFMLNLVGSLTPKDKNKKIISITPNRNKFTEYLTDYSYFIFIILILLYSTVCIYFGSDTPDDTTSFHGPLIPLIIIPILLLATSVLFYIQTSMSFLYRLSDQDKGYYILNQSKAVDDISFRKTLYRVFSSNTKRSKYTKLVLNLMVARGLILILISLAFYAIWIIGGWPIILISGVISIFLFWGAHLLLRDYAMAKYLIAFCESITILRAAANRTPIVELLEYLTKVDPSMEVRQAAKDALIKIRGA